MIGWDFHVVNAGGSGSLIRLIWGADNFQQALKSLASKGLVILWRGFEILHPNQRSARSIFWSRDENENFSYSISHIKTRREFLTLDFMLLDKTENNFLQSQVSRRDQDSLSSDFEKRTRMKIRTICAMILEKGIFCCCDHWGCLSHRRKGLAHAGSWFMTEG